MGPGHSQYLEKEGDQIGSPGIAASRETMRTTSALSTLGTLSQTMRGSGLVRWSLTCLASPGAQYGRRRCRCPSTQVRRPIGLFHQNSPMLLFKTLLLALVCQCPYFFRVTSVLCYYVVLTANYLVQGVIVLGNR